MSEEGLDAIAPVASASPLTPEFACLLYSELRRIAHRYFEGQPAGMTLQATAVVHEAFIKLSGDGSGSDLWKSREHFLGAAASTMRHILVDAVRARVCDKRGRGWMRVSLNAVEDEPDAASTIDVLALHEALGEYSKMDRAGSRLVELRFFAGLSIEEAARVMGISRATAAREWLAARTWLASKLL